MSALKNEAQARRVTRSKTYADGMMVEAIEWTLPQRKLPDDETTVLLRLDIEAFDDRVGVGYRLAGEWISSEGFTIEDKHVFAWAHMPAGPEVRE